MPQSPYIPNTDADRRAMLDKIGVASADELFRDIPQQYCHAAFDLPAPLSEMELKSELGKISRTNVESGEYACFLGAGFYNHFIPSIVPHLTGRSEFYTSYTPYQPEISQGTLQSLYEFQSMVCALTGMEVANAGMYDGSTAAAEATLMACRITKRQKIVVQQNVNPNYQDVIKTYAWGHELQFEQCQFDSLPEDAACVILQQPDFFGCFNDIVRLVEDAHKQGIIVIVATNPILLGMYKAPGDYGADVVVAEGQPFGTSLNFGGPGVGIFACRKDYVRQMPGRIVGRTLDVDDRPGYVLTLATREQHIRRERATSNICTSEALVAIAAAVYLAAMGKTGLRKVAELCYQKAHYATSEISKLNGYSLAFDKPFFNEFTINCPTPPSDINRVLLEEKIVGGLDVSGTVQNGILLAVTEMNTKEEIDRLVRVLGTFSEGVR